MRPLIRLVLLNLLPIDHCSSWLAQPALIFAHVVELCAAHCEVWLSITITFEDLPSELLVQFHICYLLLALICATDEGLLGRSLWHFEILLRQVRLS